MKASSDLSKLVTDNTSPAEESPKEVSGLNPDRAMIFADQGKKLLETIELGEDPSEQLKKVLSLAYGAVGTYVNMLGFYQSDASSRMLLYALLWAHSKDSKYLPQISSSVSDWMKLILMRDDQTAFHFIIQDILGEKAAEAMATVAGVETRTAKAWLKKQDINPRRRRELKELAQTLQESKLFYLKHLSEDEFVHWWFEPKEEWGGDSPLQYWNISPYRVQAYVRALSKADL